MAIDLRAVAKRLRKSALVRRLGREALVQNRARDIVRALLPAPSMAEAVYWPSTRPPSDAPGSPRTSEEPANLPAHLGQIVHKRLDRLVETIDFADADDAVEALHDLRVSSRRLRAFVQLFEPLLDPPIAAHVGKPLRRVTRAAGELRDVDVQIALLEARIAAQSTDAARAALEHLLERIHGRRDAVQAHAQRRLRKVKKKDIGVGVAAALGEVVARLPASSADAARLGWTLLEPLVEGVEQHEKGLGPESPPAALHELRIGIKKLRYALELVAPLLGEDQRELIKRTESLQELLGTHHDLVVISGLMDDERRALEGRGRKTLPFGLTLLRGELDAEERELALRFEAARAAPGYFRDRIQAALARA
ncbi:MAG TPA: CHAD domain-containing protein [Polyangiaceae bacterium]|nr:CHAD domain-containing protein [Polyangiaceae bacterium]